MTRAYSSLKRTVFRPRWSASPPGTSRSRMSERAPVQSTRMSPGSSIDMRLFGGHLAGDALHGPGRARLDQVAQRALDGVERDEALGPRVEPLPQVAGDGAAVGEARLELDRLEDGLDALAIDRVHLVALDGVGDEVRRERHHPRPGVLAPSLVEADGLALDRLEQSRQEEADRTGADDVDSARRSFGRVSLDDLARRRHGVSWRCGGVRRGSPDGTRRRRPRSTALAYLTRTVMDLAYHPLDARQPTRERPAPPADPKPDDGR